MSLCEEDCEYKGYDKSTKTMECSCGVKLSASLVTEIKIDKSKLYDFIDITQIANFKVMKCIKLLFSKEGIITNIGFYSFFPVIIAYLISIIIFKIKEYDLIKKQIDLIVLAKKGITEPEPKKNQKHIFFNNIFLIKKWNSKKVKMKIYIIK